MVSVYPSMSAIARSLPSLPCLLAALAAGAAEVPGPSYESLQNQPEVTRFLWWGHVRAPADPDTAPAAFLFVAIDSSWLLIEHDGEIAGVGAQSWYETPPPLAAPPAPIAPERFERATGRAAEPFAGLCDRYEVLRASLEHHWHARRIWRGRVSMQQSMFLELFTAADGRWAWVLHAPLLEDPQRQACMPLRGFHSRLFEQPPLDPPPQG